MRGTTKMLVRCGIANILERASDTSHGPPPRCVVQSSACDTQLTHGVAVLKAPATRLEATCDEQVTSVASKRSGEEVQLPSTTSITLTEAVGTRFLQGNDGVADAKLVSALLDSEQKRSALPNTMLGHAHNQHM